MASKKTYTKEFKEEAVRLAQQNGNVTETACNLGLQDRIWSTRVCSGAGRSNRRMRVSGPDDARYRVVSLSG